MAYLRLIVAVIGQFSHDVIGSDWCVSIRVLLV